MTLKTRFDEETTSAGRGAARESCTAGLVFYLPADARESVPLLNESSPATRFVVGREDGTLHKKTVFRL